MLWKGSICLLSFIMLFFSSLISFMLGLTYMFNDLVVFIDWEVISLGSSSITMTVLLDWMSLIFMGFVMFISSMVIIYSEGYMEGDLTLSRFIILVLLFVLSMMFMIISPNLISILLGWDGLGLVSYCLVIYYQNVSSYNAGMLTVLVNRIGDVALLMSIGWMLSYGSWNYLFYINRFGLSNMKFIMIMILIAAFTKSAQIPFSSWLPAAMAAPTPVSALVHSSTLVTAGVYLLIRFSNLLLYFDLSGVLMFIGGLTTLLAGVNASLEFDLSKIIALSTLSQLGLMISVLSMGCSKLAFFHLLSHALFKALLFMCAGNIIHNMMNCQDIRSMGGLIMFMPLTSLCFFVSNLALCGMPFLAGFYSKDLILEMSLVQPLNLMGLWFFFFSTGGTVNYTVRLCYLVIFGDLKFSSVFNMGDGNWKMLGGMIPLTFMGVIGGSLLSWIIFPDPILVHLPLSLKLMPLLFCMLGFTMAFLLYTCYYLDFSTDLSYLKYTFRSVLFFPYMFSYVFKFPLIMGFYNMKVNDKGWLEDLGGQGFYKIFIKKSGELEFIQSSILKSFLLLLTMWLVVILFITMI
uniref:NADH-ubiquinone oxidoreductase chain 5 n=1 Tax=Myrmecophilus manni TaxID=270849 RepID=B6DE94_9ORTH|nr:NADH dehydrogenase subunit 5 [Myrmecophilus manni]ACG59290.1 NADH dehydrogenase subunit 5 [Myrmecophilus manni]